MTLFYPNYVTSTILTGSPFHGHPICIINFSFGMLGILGGNGGNLSVGIVKLRFGKHDIIISFKT